MKIALVQDFLNQYGGAERVLEAIHELYPEADVYTLIHEPARLPDNFKTWKIHESPYTSLIPFRNKIYKGLLPAYPMLIEQFDFRKYDIVISSSYLFAKGVLTPSTTCHICYCHTPMRQAWELYHTYKEHYGKGLLSIYYTKVFHYIRLWDIASKNRVDYFIANSKTVRNRIKKYYRREAEVIFPPVDTHKFSISVNVDDYYLCLSRLVPYKRTDLAVRAFNKLGKKLVVAGDGPELKKLKKIAKKNIEFVGSVSDDEKGKLLSKCNALIFPGLEDFGIVPVEAQASGRPVIAYRGGGALETVEENKTGVFFNEFTPDSLVSAVHKLAKLQFEPEEIRNLSFRFDRKVFLHKFRQYLESAYTEFNKLY
ncbi:glycosyltransferase [bacterium]|nr:glycosyltransferase [bacterium]